MEYGRAAANQESYRRANGINHLPWDTGAGAGSVGYKPMSFRQNPIDGLDGFRSIETVKEDTIRRRISKAADLEGLFFGMHREPDLEGLWYLTKKQTYRLHQSRQTLRSLAQRFDVLEDHEVMEGGNG